MSDQLRDLRDRWLKWYRSPSADQNTALGAMNNLLNELSALITDPQMNPVVESLVEVVQVAMGRMDAGEVHAEEAWTLGMIVGIAMRIPEVVEQLNAIEEEKVNVIKV